MNVKSDWFVELATIPWKMIKKNFVWKGKVPGLDRIPTLPLLKLYVLKASYLISLRMFPHSAVDIRNDICKVTGKWQFS